MTLPVATTRAPHRWSVRGDLLEQLIPTRTTLPLPAAALPVQVWEALLGLEPEKFPDVSARLLEGS